VIFTETLFLPGERGRLAQVRPYLGNLNRNQFDPNSVSNQFGAGSPYRPTGVNNQFSPNYTPGLAPPRPCYGYGC
jgi:hypothetical protein